MNETLLNTLEHELRHCLLGSLVLEKCGRDLDITRYKRPTVASRACMAGFSYRHSTLACCQHILLGFADTYWCGSSAEWEELLNVRMRLLLETAGWFVVNYELICSPKPTVRRVLGAKTVGGGEVRISEVISLPRVAEALRQNA